MDIVCKCGYEGKQVVQFTSNKTHKILLEDKGECFNWVKNLDDNHIVTFNYACPKCGRVLAYQRNYPYTFKESEMRIKLKCNSWNNKRWLREHETKPIEKKDSA